MSESKKIFLTGLPRCRSAFFSNLLTCGDSFVYHDGFDGCDTFDDFKSKMDIPYRVVGNSDPANVLFWKDIVAAYPDAVWIVIKRDVNEVHKSVNNLIPDFPIAPLYRHEELLEELQSHINAETFNFDSLDKDDCRHIAKLCDIGLDERRLEML